MNWIFRCAIFRYSVLVGYRERVTTNRGMPLASDTFSSSHFCASSGRLCSSFSAVYTSQTAYVIDGLIITLVPVQAIGRLRTLLYSQTYLPNVQLVGCKSRHRG